MNVLDTKYKIATNMKALRGFILAGGGMAKRLLAIEHGFTVSGVDFVDTRWASLIKATCYAASKQTLAHLAKARARLQQLADKGDVTALNALEEEDVQLVVFNVLYDFVESISEESLARKKGSTEEDLTKIKHNLLKYFSNPLHFAAFQLIDILFGGDAVTGTERLTTIVKLSQGDATYSAKLKSSVSNEVPDVVKATRMLVTQLSSLDECQADDIDDEVEKAAIVLKIEQRRRRVFSELRGRMILQADAVVASAKSVKHSVYDTTKPFDEKESATFIESYLKKYDTLLLPDLL